MESIDVENLLRALAFAVWLIIAIRLLRWAGVLLCVWLGAYLYLNGAPLASDAVTCAQEIVEVDGAARCKDTQSANELRIIGASIKERLAPILTPVGIELGLIDAIETAK